MKGKVKFFNESKGFGFIISEDGKEYFVHSTGLVGTSSLSKDEAVTFEIEQGEKGPKAVKVTRV